MNTEREVTPPLEQQTVVQEFTDYTKKKRHGHGNDVVDENDVRQVAGCLPLDIKNHRVLLISSRKKNNAWVLPKGGWESDETQQHAAQRETWEEAGIKGTIVKQLGVFEERTKKKGKLKAHHWIFEMHIDEVVKKFPERKKRERRWFTLEEALIVTKKHRYIQEALLCSSLNLNTTTIPNPIVQETPLSPRESLSDSENEKQPQKDFLGIERKPSILNSFQTIFS
ncbi:hypothetical protein G6F57_003375 [Rhizopus arrhizus]|uniref:Nudix hydrolase domain-containing protein n=1 Tax=Rhizopus oryzae TaxID=64495 RepID=A0A9P6XF64_RHIOR|nr:hypothetical protein G6F23_000954 [Rhizopus arrhizus]KAG1419808.1 hypothetical protein G6F58_004432 [Rhizopus delemar]KAG0766320.1 hypothetical protein G6F24_003694 [Rhizopus arrhizus]KAG0793069.1 hypothetical protein G6F21_003896 [Rhizopus arrhizus]KAG0802285.1 hypothetical protein G6F22_000415 [Rhizopus arrhizus]